MTSARDDLIRAGLLKLGRRRAKPTPAEMIKFECRECGKPFSSPFSLNLHFRLDHGGTT